MKIILKIVAGFSLFLGLAIVSALVAMNLAVKSGDVLVPDLKGKELSAAVSELNKTGLNLRIKEHRAAAEVPKGLVISQEPGPGARLKKYRDVKVVLSAGAIGIEAPKLLGESLAAAQGALSALGLAPGDLVKVHSEVAPSGQVLAQLPAPGTALESGAKVDLLVSLGRAEESYIMPNLIGMPLHEATRAVEKLNMQIERISYEAYEGLPAMIVIKQNPRSGHKAKRGEKVSLSISKGDTRGALGLEAPKLFVYTVPQDYSGRRLKIVVEDEIGAYEIFSGMAVAGGQIRRSIQATGKTRVKIFVDGLLEQERYL